MHTLTILIVDDDSMIRRTTRLMLERKGYNVLEADSGKTACELFASTTSPVDLVILDLNMPGMSGAETLMALRELDNDVKVIIASGHEIEVSTPTGQTPNGYLRKPFRMSALYDTINTHISL